MALAGASNQGPRVSRLRWIGLVLSSLLAIALLFALLFIDARDQRMEQQRQRDFGELRRIERLLRDGTDTVRAIGATAKVGDTLGPLLIKVEKFEGRQPACPNAVGADAPVRLCSSPQQVADRQIWVEVTLTVDDQRRVAQANLAPLINTQSIDSRVSHVAIIDGSGKVLLPLRGDGPLPANLRVALPDLLQDGNRQERHVKAEAQAAPQEVTIAGSSYQYYEVPLDLSNTALIGDVVTEKCQARECSIAALVAVPGIIEDLRSLSPMTRAIFTGLLALFLLANPIVKLVTIDRNASLHWLDVAAIGVSLPLITATLTLMLMVLGGWETVRKDADQTSAAIANHLRAHVTAEIETTRREMVGALDGKFPDQAQVLPLDGMRVFDTDGAAVRLDDVRKGREVAEESGLGFIRRRVALSTGASPKDRPYFQRLLRGETIQEGARYGVVGKAPLRASPDAYVIDQVRSIADGASKLVLAFRQDAPPAAGESGSRPEPHVILAIKQLAATMSLPLPEGFGYAIVNPDTLDVLQHSDPSRPHVDNFGEQFSRSRQFHAFRERMKRQCGAQAAAAESSGARRRSPDQSEPARIAAVRYNGIKSNMSLLPICAANWIAVVWYEIPSVQTLPVEAGMLAGGMVALWALLFAGLAVLAAMPGSKRHFRWLWPSPSLKDRPALWRLLAAQLAWAAFGLGSLLLLRGDARLWHAVGCTVVLVHIARTLRPAREDTSSSRFDPGARRARGAIDWLLLGLGVAALIIAAWSTPGTNGNVYGGFVGVALLLRLAAEAVAARRRRARHVQDHSPIDLPGPRSQTQRAQVVLIIAVQTAALVTLGILPAAAAYLTAWDTTRIVRRDADVERYEAAQAGGLQQIRTALSGYTPAASHLCDHPPRSLADARIYFQGWLTVPPGQHDFSLQALRRWFGEPVRSDRREPLALDQVMRCPSKSPGSGR